MTSIEDYKRLTSMTGLLQRHGVRVRGRSVDCPSRDHDDHGLDARLYTGRRGDERVHCHACLFDEDVIGVARALGESLDVSFPYRPPVVVEPLPAEFDAFLDALRNRPTWPFEWEAAKLLATLPVELARQDVRGSWDYLSARRNVKLILLTADMIRGKGHIFPHTDEAAEFGAVPHCPLCDSEWCAHIGVPCND